MGQQETMLVATEEKGGGAMLLRRMLLLLVVAAVMAVMTVAMSGPASAAGNHFAKGKGNAFVSTNPGEDVNDTRGDAKANACLVHGKCNPGFFGISNSDNGIGVLNN